MIRRLKHWALALGVTLLAACGGGGGDRNLAETASGSQNLTILAEAVAAADLGTTLAGPGQFTLFAPTERGLLQSLQALRGAWARPRRGEARTCLPAS